MASVDIKIELIIFSKYINTLKSPRQIQGIT